jgi:hypothetical protein
MPRRRPVAPGTPQGGYLVEAVLPLDGHHDEAEPT